MTTLPLMNSLVRPMNRNDLEAVGAMSDQLGYPVDSADLNVRFEELSKLPNHALMVCEDSTVKGWIHLEAVFDLIEEQKVEIKALVVDESSRGRGTGSHLVKAACEWAKTYGVSTIYLSCNIIRDRAHKFYEREGFIKVKTSHFFEMKI
jgi:GNAT superfamily N-acetyltransferase